MLRCVLSALFLFFLSTVVCAEEPVITKSWYSVEQTRGGQYRQFGFISTQITQDNVKLSIKHDIKLLAPSKKFVLTATVNLVYQKQQGKLMPLSALFLTDVSGSAKVKSELKFADEGYVETFTMTRDLAGKAITEPKPHVTKRKLKHHQFIVVWSLPELVPLLLSKKEALVVAFPKFPDKTPIANNSSITSEEYIYYTLKRETEPTDKNKRFSATPAGKERAEWVMIVSKEGKFNSLEMPKRILITPIAEDEFKKLAQPD